ncbi:MAG: radical SAM family heme chaperone HemW [Candidatus Neomarinimicrobiota bacterium]
MTDRIPEQLPPEQAPTGANSGSDDGAAVALPAAGIYIHIPFCKIKCHYCDFYSLADRDEAMARFIGCLVEEIKLTGDAPRTFRFDTLYIGGGTPSLLAPRHLESLLSALQQIADLSHLQEFTLEANPGEAPEEKLRAFRGLGVNRLSMGFQSFDPDLLKFLGRLHGPEDCTATFDVARRVGFDNISADLMFNIPGQSLARWQADLAALADLQPEHISAYSLTVEKGTGLHKLVAAGEVVMPAEQTDVSMFTWARQFLPQRGYRAYEISNYARDGRTCRHNCHYWRIEPYLGFGPSAHAFDGWRRSWNVRSLDGYMEAVESGRSPVAADEIISPSQLHNEKLAFGLRLMEGLSVTDDLGYGSAGEFADVFGEQLGRWGDRITLTGDRLALDAGGVLLADAIAADMFVGPADAVPVPGLRGPKVPAGS